MLATHNLRVVQMSRIIQLGEFPQGFRHGFWGPSEWPPDLQNWLHLRNSPFQKRFWKLVSLFFSNVFRRSFNLAGHVWRPTIFGSAFPLDMLRKPCPLWTSVLFHWASDVTLILGPHKIGRLTVEMDSFAKLSSPNPFWKWSIVFFVGGWQDPTLM